MRRLVFIVEGDTEIILIQDLIVPYLIEEGFTNPMHAQTITTNRKQYKKGGVGSYGKYKNEVNRTLAQGNVVVTSIIDFFQLPTDFPAYTQDSGRINDIESAIIADFGNNSDFLPYIQRHELEALMFSSMDGFKLVVDDEEKLKEIEKIIKDYPNPEDINNSEQNAPSKRLKRIFNYDKTGDGELIFQCVGMDAILMKCPRFATWIETIKQKLR